MQTFTLPPGDVDFLAARQMADNEAKKILASLMLIASGNRITGEEYPYVPECQHQPGWLAYAEGYNGRLRVDINNEQFSFIFIDTE